MAEFANISDEVFRVLNSFNYTLLLYDDEDMQVTEPGDARRMFDRDHNIMVSIIDDDDDSRIVLHLGNHTHAAQVMGLIQALRTAATKYNVTFRVQNYNKDIDPKQFTHLASISEAKDRVRMDVLEGMYGTSRSSYLRLENARMIVRHKTRIDDSKAGARSRCIETILVENSAGERHRFPTTNLAAGRAMTQHVNQGGNFADPIGQQITSMALEYANLSSATKQIGSLPLSEAITAVREACRSKMHKLRKTFECLYRPSTYAMEVADLTTCANLLTESDAKIDEARLAELRQLLTDVDDEVVECAARAMDEVKEALIIEDDGSVAVIDDRRVDRAAWEDLDRGKLRMRSRPVFDRHPFKSAISELVYRLGQIAPNVEDHSMANLLSYVADRLPEASDKKDLAMIGLKALKAARRQAIEPELTESATIADDTVNPLGDYHVAANVWRDLQNQRIELTGTPMFDTHGFTSPVAELVYRLGQIVPKVKDDGLANLLAYVADELPLNRNKKYAAIGMAALKAARSASQTPHKLASKNKVVKEFEHWIAGFSIDRLLEYEDPSDPMNPYSHLHQHYDNALARAIADFDPKYFLADDDSGGELIADRDTANPDENTLDKQEVVACLTYYLRREVERDSGIAVQDDRAVHNMAKQVYDSVVSALHDRGFVVQDNVTEDLTREDVLLPPRNQGDGLAREVSKPSVTDPDRKDRMQKPDSVYVSRLKTLAGMNAGANSPGY